MPHSKTVKPLVVYLIIILVLAFGLNLFLKNYSKANYSDAKKEELLTTPSKFRLLNDDPCASSIFGDPGGVKDNYIKVNIHCGEDNESSNALEIRSISPGTYIGALQMVGNINGFSTGVIPQRVDKLGNLISDNNEWRCFTGIDSEIKNFDSKLKKEETINCFYKFSEQQRQKYYETH